jgi:hypothetical protein
MIRATLLPFALAFALGAAAESGSEVRSGPVEVVARLSPESPRIGDTLELVIEARAEAGVELIMPAFGEALDRFRVVAFVPTEEVGDDGLSVSRQRYSLQAARSGAQSIPPLLVEFVDRRPGREAAPAGEDAYELLTEAIEFEVSSVLPEGAPLELRPPLGALGPRRAGAGSLAPWLIGLALLLAALAPFVVRAIAARRARERRASAYEVARAELDALLYGPRPDAQGMDAFFVKLSFVVRRYLEDRFGLRSPELTTEEFLNELTRSPDLYRAHRDLLRSFLVRADLVKFAGHIPDDGGVQESIDTAQRFLEETREADRA